MCENRFMTPSENCKKTLGCFVLNRDNLLLGGMFVYLLYFIFISVVIHKRKCFRQRLFWENLVNHDEPYRQENSFLTYEDKKYFMSFYH